MDADVRMCSGEEGGGLFALDGDVHSKTFRILGVVGSIGFMHFGIFSGLAIFLGGSPSCSGCPNTLAPLLVPRDGGAFFTGLSKATSFHDSDNGFELHMLLSTWCLRRQLREGTLTFVVVPLSASWIAP